MANAPDFDAIAATSRHGTRPRYKHGCRCDTCRAANTAYQRQRRNALRSAIPIQDSDVSTGGWAVPIAGVAVGLAAVWAIIRKAAAS